MQVAPFLRFTGKTLHDSGRCSVHVSQIKCFITTYMHPCTNGSRSFWLLFGILAKPDTWMSHYHRRIKHQPAFEATYVNCSQGYVEKQHIGLHAVLPDYPFQLKIEGASCHSLAISLIPNCFIWLLPSASLQILSHCSSTSRFRFSLLIALGFHFSSSLPSAPPNPSCEWAI